MQNKQEFFIHLFTYFVTIFGSGIFAATHRTVRKWNLGKPETGYETHPPPTIS